MTDNNNEVTFKSEEEETITQKPSTEVILNNLIGAFNNLAGMVEKLELRLKLLEQKEDYEKKLAEK
jgi:hypothetical protein